MKSSFRCFVLLSLTWLSACDTTITQTTNVPRPVVNVVVQPPAPAQPSSTVQPPLTLQAPSARPVNQPLPTGTASAKPALPELELSAIPGPSATPYLPVGLERFASSIPEPASTRGYDSQSMAAAQLLWQQHYLQIRHDPYEVLRMYLDAGMIAWYNETLAAGLNQQVLHSKTPWLFPSYPLMDAQAVAGSKEYAIRSYFRATSKLNNYLLPDFEARTVNLVSKNSRGEYLELGAQDLSRLAPAVPSEGSSFKCHLYSSASRSDVELSMIYHEGGWKVDFWTPNILVVFMP